jgi:hypothetical protein
MHTSREIQLDVVKITHAVLAVAFGSAFVSLADGRGYFNTKFVYENCEAVFMSRFILMHGNGLD